MTYNYPPLTKLWLLTIASYVLVTSQTTATTSLCKKSITFNEKDNEIVTTVKDNKYEDLTADKMENILNTESPTGDNLLHVAVACRSHDALNALLAFGLDPNAQNKRGYTPLWYAVELGDAGVVQTLNASGADFTLKAGSYNDTLLHAACRNGNDEMVSMLLQTDLDVNERNSRGETPLWVATEKGHQILVHMLLQEGASVDCRQKAGETPLHSAASYGHLAIVQNLIKNGARVNSRSLFGVTPLHKASEGGHSTVIQELIFAGANLNGSKTSLGGLEPLHLASFNVNAVSTLLENGADVNARAFNGATPMHWVCWGSLDNSQSEVVQLLLERGADVNSKMASDFTPLHLASSIGSRRTVEKLLSSGAQANARDVYNRTPLHYSTTRNDERLVKLLLLNGADRMVQDLDGETPINWAINHGQELIARLLNKQTEYYDY